MSLIESVVLEALRIAKDISINQNEIINQLRQLDEITNSTEKIMGGTATGADKRVFSLISDASRKGKAAQEKLREASIRLSKWAGVSGVSENDSGTSGTYNNGISTEKSYSSILETRYNNAMSNVKEVFDNFMNDVVIQNKDLPLNETPHYSPSNKAFHPRGVYYNAASDNSNPRGAGTTFYHEIGHMIDHLANDLNNNMSFNDRFGDALLSDGQNIINLFNELSAEGRQKFLSLINEDSSHSLSDLLEATTNSQIRGAYGHGADYWKTNGNMQAEAFAHFFEASMGADDKRKLLEMFFPNSFGVFNEMIDSLHQPIPTKSYTRRI